LEKETIKTRKDSKQFFVAQANKKGERKKVLLLFIL